MRFTPLAFAVVMSVIAAPATAKTCKEPLTAKSTTRVAGDQAAREKRATANAIDNWRDAARRTQGIVYRFWSRANDRATTCKSTPSSTTCTAIATPCRLL
jgi:hypothetical protein